MGMADIAKGAKSMSIRYLFLSGVALLLLGAAMLLVYRHYSIAKGQEVTSPVAQYRCVKAPQIQPPPSPPAIVQAGSSKQQNRSQPIICPPGYIAQPVGVSAPKGIPRP